MRNYGSPQALYTRLERDLQELDEALLMTPDRAIDRKAWAANMRLARTASLLDRTGWTYHEQRPQVKLDRVEDVALAVSVLRDDPETEGNVKAAASTTTQRPRCSPPQGANWRSTTR